MRRATFTRPTQHSSSGGTIRQGVTFALALTLLAVALGAALMLLTTELGA